MMKVSTIVLVIFVITVTANPVPQQCSICQQGPKNSAISPATYTSSQNNPCSKPNTILSQTPTPPSLDDTINQLLMSKILGNPSLQKILDPNTKLYNQNGQEVRRNPNSNATPSVINNYFIVPPEFFCLNGTKKADNENACRKRKVNSRKANRRKNNSNAGDSDNSIIISDSESSAGQNQSSHPNKMRRKNKTKVKEQCTGSSTETSPKEAKSTRKRRKQSSQNKTKESTLPSIKSDFVDLSKNENTLTANNVPNKRRKRPKKLNTTTTKSIKDSDSILISQDDLSYASDLKTTSLLEDVPSGTKLKLSSADFPYLRNIMSPVDDLDIMQDLTEHRNTRNSKTSSSKKSGQSTQSAILTPEDYFRTFFPYFSNYLNSNGNFPFNYEQLNNPYYVKTKKRNKKRKHKTKQNNTTNNTAKETQPNVINVKPKQEVTTSTTTTEKTVSEKSTEPTQLNLERMETTTQSTDKHKEMPEFLFTETFSPKKPLIKTKANLEMPPTLIEELNEFMMPELGKEEVIPTIHTNAIIRDYYPIFYDDPYYANEESYYVRNLDDDRHFYTTDRGHEEELNRDRRKYDKYDENRPNLEDNNENFSHGSVYKERGKLKSLDGNHKTVITTSRPYTVEKTIEKTDVPKKREEKAQFVTPPFLEHPDFRTKKVDVVSFKNEKQDVENHDPIYIEDWRGTVLDKSETHPNIKSQHFDSLISFTPDIKREKILTTVRPTNEHIETVFAKSRVVKYGVTKSEEDISVSLPTYEDDGDMKHNSDGHTTFILAKSLGDVDDYYW